MKIITYHQLQNKDEFTMLMELAFGSPGTPSFYDKLTKWDNRFKNSPIGFCAIENSKLASHVGVLDIPLKTLEGKKEIIGGIRAVATNPDFAKRGLAGLLMERAHEYFKEKRYRFSFLCTSRSLIAYAGYKRLGYVEVEAINQVPKVYKVLKRKSTPKLKKKKLNHKKIGSLFEEFVRDKFGFTIRQKDYIKLYLFRKLINEKQFAQMDNGYVFLSKTGEARRIMEMVASDRETYEKLVAKAEEMSTGGIIDHYVYDPILMDVYRSRGYKIQASANYVFMVKPLDKTDYREVFGDRIYFPLLEWF